ncbi:hypothetical protein HMPREF9123_0530 [Neisseria bacilliformis ATCC BAA-1200]|uniref:Uncharacterized protein n=1 Tax=Neisseria bacilliformis ATCC BAA-1200 TaxID=888742 RepID=F2BA01_9NEIS|nr:hypothetical protein HMPREF9123_0530 [Neisseria bacilliformis ATCC BAA-1200]
MWRSHARGLGAEERIRGRLKAQLRRSRNPFYGFSDGLFMFSEYRLSRKRNAR